MSGGIVAGRCLTPPRLVSRMGPTPSPTFVDPPEDRPPQPGPPASGPDAGGPSWGPPSSVPPPPRPDTLPVGSPVWEPGRSVLAPMGVGETLDAAIKLYRRHWRPFM